MVKFGVVVWKTANPYPFTYDDLKSLAADSESLGFESFWLSDHLQAETKSDPQFECFTTLSALARETHRIRLGPLVACNIYRSPSLLAKISATLDVVSEGRLDLGIGAGWDLDECNAYGIPFFDAKERVNRLEDTLQILKRMWQEESATFHGKSLKIDAAYNVPRPVQKPHPPIWIGARGKRMLGLVARYGNGWNIDTAFTPEAYQEKLNLLMGNCRALQRDLTTIRKSIALEFVIAKTRNQAQMLAKKIASYGNIPMAEYTRRTIIGDPEEVVERLVGYTSLDVDLIICYFADWQRPESINLFSDKVIPHL